MKHVPVLDGIRGIAIATVLVAHRSYGLIDGGFLGVDLFFVLSGYLITTLLLEEQRKQGQISLGAFYIRRVCRLMPALLAALALALVCRTLSSHKNDVWGWERCASA